MLSSELCDTDIEVNHRWLHSKSCDLALVGRLRYIPSVPKAGASAGFAWPFSTDH